MQASSLTFQLGQSEALTQIKGEAEVGSVLDFKTQPHTQPVQNGLIKTHARTEILAIPFALSQEALVELERGENKKVKETAEAGDVWMKAGG